MPSRPARLCAKRLANGSYCPRLALPGRGCPVHGLTKPWQSARRAEYHTPEHRQLRRIVLEEESVCWRCGGPGLPDDQMGHVVALADGGQTVRSNCHREHRACNLRAGCELGALHMKQRARRV